MQYLLKSFYIIPAIMVLVCNAGIAMMIIRESGLTKPYFWLILISAVAYIAEGFCYKGWIK